MEEIDITISKLIWDDWNIEHIAHHEVTTEEVEASLADTNAIYLKAKRGRVMVLGRTGSRLVTTVMNQQKNPQEFYIITSRDMSKKERAYYREQLERSRYE
jgi:uncharacterized DUF497 family protein